MSVTECTDPGKITGCINRETFSWTTVKMYDAQIESPSSRTVLEYILGEFKDCWVGVKQQSLTHSNPNLKKNKLVASM
jgi:hypothetical protein